MPTHRSMTGIYLRDIPAQRPTATLSLSSLRPTSWFKGNNIVTASLYVWRRTERCRIFSIYDVVRRTKESGSKSPHSRVLASDFFPDTPRALILS